MKCVYSFVASFHAYLLCVRATDQNYFFHSLAMAELSLCLAVLHRPGGPELELFKTDESDVKHVHDFLIPLPKVDTKGVRVLVR